MTNLAEYSQGRKPRLLDGDCGICERDGFHHSSLGLRPKRTVAIERNGLEEIVDGERFAAVSQMKEDGVRRRGVQVALLGPARKWVNNQGCSR